MTGVLLVTISHQHDNNRRQIQNVDGSPVTSARIVEIGIPHFGTLRKKFRTRTSFKKPNSTALAQARGTILAEKFACTKFSHFYICDKLAIYADS